MIPRPALLSAILKTPPWNSWPHAWHPSPAGLVGSAAAVLTTVALLPQIWRVWSTRSAKDVSLGMFLLYSAGVLLWLVYGLLIHSLPVELANGFSLLFALSLLALKLRFDRRER